MPKNDPPIDEIRRVRHSISKEVDHDLRKLKAVFSKLEARFEHPAVTAGAISTNSAVITPVVNAK